MKRTKVGVTPLHTSDEVLQLIRDYLDINIDYYSTTQMLGKMKRNQRVIALADLKEYLDASMGLKVSSTLAEVPAHTHRVKQ